MAIIFTVTWFLDFLKNLFTLLNGHVSHITGNYANLAYLCMLIWITIDY